MSGHYHVEEDGNGHDALWVTPTDSTLPHVVTYPGQYGTWRGFTVADLHVIADALNAAQAHDAAYQGRLTETLDRIEARKAQP